MFRVTNLRSDDRLGIAQADAYLWGNPDPGVRARPPQIVEQAMESGLCLSVERKGKLCGLSLIYQYDTPFEGVVYSEIGTMRITENGFGLQEFLANFHLLQLRLEEFAEQLPRVFAVVSPDTASEHNMMTKVGMQPWDPPYSLRLQRQLAGVPFTPAKSVLIADPSTFENAAVTLRGLHTVGNEFRTPKSSELISIATRWFHPDVLEDVE